MVKGKSKYQVFNQKQKEYQLVKSKIQLMYTEYRKDLSLYPSPGELYNEFRKEMVRFGGDDAHRQKKLTALYKKTLKERFEADG